MVDSQFTWAADQDLIENCTWIEELALYKPSHLPKLSHVNIYEAGDVEQTKSWNIPGTLSRLYKTRKIELEVTVRRLLEYQPSAEPEYWEDRWEYRFTPCAARDPNVLNDIWFTLPEVIPDSTEDARVEAALKAYSSKMRTDNRLFLAERTKEIKAMKLPTPRDEVNRMARFGSKATPALSGRCKGTVCQLWDPPTAAASIRHFGYRTIVWRKSKMY